MRLRLVPLLALLAPAILPAQPASTHPAVRRWEFIYTAAPFVSAHASTIAETRDGLVAAWFGGTREGGEDVAIWLSRLAAGSWTPPVSVATGEQADGRRYPCWNPVLAPWPDGTLRLYYKVGPSPATWWGMLSVSRDGGRSWSRGERLPEGILGPVKNKPVWLPTGRVLSPSSTESAEPVSRWRVHFEISADSGRSWTRAAPPILPTRVEPDAIQPTILQHPAGVLQALARTRSGWIFETWSRDGGTSWTPVSLTRFPNPNAGIDAVTLRDGRHLMVYNHTREGRSRLFLAVSPDGRAWTTALELENDPGEYSYPAIIQARDGSVHLTYTWNRNHIMYVALDPAGLSR
jgi:predicted neuraminidase